MNYSARLGNEIKLITFDIDGTVLPYLSDLDEYTINILNCLSDRGIELLPNSGRGWESLKEAVKNVKGIKYLSASNGSIILKKTDHSVVYSNPLSIEKAISIFDLLIDLGCNPLVILEGMNCRQDLVRLKNPDDLTDKQQRAVESVYSVGLRKTIESGLFDVHKISCKFDDTAHRMYVRNKMEQMGEIYCCNAHKMNLEMVHYMNNKGNALKKVADILQIKMDNVLALGDANNDIPMLKMAGYSVVMKGSVEAVIKYAKEVTRYEVDEDGAGRYLEDLLKEMQA
ncbi:MAG: HAD family phosphatase [Erysipelotrichaceae bacterium]|nr:HAD family phosphatase [Erysipelotrichaceae bacterium]